MINNVIVFATEMEDGTVCELTATGERSADTVADEVDWFGDDIQFEEPDEMKKVCFPFSGIFLFELGTLS